MSSTVETSATATIQERTKQATRDLCSALGLGVVSPGDVKYLTLALTGTAAEEAATNDDFAERLRTRYEALLPARSSKGSKTKSTTTRSRGGTSWNVQLTPIGTVDESLLDPYAPPNPFALRQIYGDDQLPLALGRYSPAELKKAITVVQEQYPGTRPRKVSKAGIIEYILETLNVLSASEIY